MPPHPPSTRLFVAKLPPCVREDEFRAHFAACGTLVDAYMPKERTQQHYRGIGFVTYSSLQDAQRVVNNHHRFQGHRVIVDFAAPKALNSRHCGSSGDQVISGEPNFKPAARVEMIKSSAAQDELKLRVRDDFQDKLLAKEIIKSKRESSCQQQSSFQAQHIPLISSDIWGLPCDPCIGAGFQYAACPSPLSDRSDEDDNSVLENLLREMNRQTGCSVLQTPSNPTEFETGPCISSMPMSPGSVSSSVPSQRTSSSGDWAADQRTKPRVYVGRLPKAVTAIDLGNYFSKFGEVSDVYIPRSRDCRSKHRGFGFVSFASEETIKLLVAHGPHKLKGLPIVLDFPIQEEYCSKNVHAPLSK